MFGKEDTKEVLIADLGRQGFKIAAPQDTDGFGHSVTGIATSIATATTTSRSVRTGCTTGGAGTPVGCSWSTARGRPPKCGLRGCGGAAS